MVHQTTIDSIEELLKEKLPGHTFSRSVECVASSHTDPYTPSGDRAILIDINVPTGLIRCPRIDIQFTVKVEGQYLVVTDVGPHYYVLGRHQCELADQTCFQQIIDFIKERELNPLK